MGACAKSNWYETDHKCICGASGADWITKDQCKSCTMLPAAEVATTDACPWQSETGGCMNAEGVCNKACAKSNWYQTDHKCICGASGADWITKDQCKSCTENMHDNVELVV